MRLIFVNLPVSNLKAATEFFSGLGFTINPQFSDGSCACMVVDRNILVMLLDHDRFREFINGEISDATKATEVITCLSAESRQQVDDIVSKAIASGGKPWKPRIEAGPMYGGSFQDLDGHVWEVMHMGMPADGEPFECPPIESPPIESPPIESPGIESPPIEAAQPEGTTP